MSTASGGGGGGGGGHHYTDADDDDFDSSNFAQQEGRLINLNSLHLLLGLHVHFTSNLFGYLQLLLLLLLL